MSAGFKASLFTQEYFPGRANRVPFGENLNKLFFNPPASTLDFPLHGPNAVRFIKALAKGELTSEADLVKDDQVVELYSQHYEQILDALGARIPKNNDRVVELLRVAVLFHDIGKSIRRANHPSIGSNMLRNFDGVQRRKLVEALVYKDEDQTTEHKHNRFSLIASIIQHHDKFGVVSTGEAGLPIFADVLYFTSGPDSIDGIKKNITSVMLANLADIAAVYDEGPDPAKAKAAKERANQLAGEVWAIRGGGSGDEAERLAKLREVCASGVCLGLDARKVEKVLADWQRLIELVDAKGVLGNRVRLKHKLLEIERNPARAIERIHRLIEACTIASGSGSLVDPRFLSSTTVESVLVGTLGAHQFQTFAERLATVAKMDYSLNFFRAIICASVRKELYPGYRVGLRPKWDYRTLSNDEQTQLAAMEPNRKAQLTDKIVTLFVKTIEGLLNRYEGVLGYSASSVDPRRFGFQMGTLGADGEIRDVIIDLLCVQEFKDPIALTLLVDEVTLWTMD